MTARYQPTGTVGRGAMGEVLRAKDVLLDREVAYKRISAENLYRRGVLDRFVEEARITAQLDHPGIVPVYALEAQGAEPPAYAMKLVDGRTFEEVLEACAGGVRAGRAPEVELTDRLVVFLRICEAVHYAHSRGVVHRDLKPANVMVGRFHEVYVMDWGLAKRVDGPDPLLEADEEAETRVMRTRAGTVMGTPSYMAPEQARGENHAVDARADQYALGAMLEELVCLRPPLEGLSIEQVLWRVATGDRPPIEPLAGPVPGDLRAIWKRATALRPKERYPSVDALAEDVRRYLQGESVAARPDGVWRSAARRLARHRNLALGLVLGLATVALSVMVGGGALLAAQARAADIEERRLAAVLADVTARADALDAQLFLVQGLLATLADTAVVALAHGTDADVPLYLDTDYAGAAAPADLGPSVGHAHPVSWRHAVLRPAAGVPAEAVAPAMRRLAPLAPYLRRLYLQSRGSEGLPEDAAIDLLRREGAPLVGAYVALEQGLHMSFPGHGPYPADYDPRKRPWYALGREGRGPRWERPHLDVNGQGLLLVCAQPLYDASERFLGVAGVEVAASRVVAALGDGTAWLLDADGRVVLRGDRLDDAGVGEPFGLPVVRGAVIAGEPGWATRGDEVLAWTRLSSTGWWVVRRDARRPRKAPVAGVPPRG